MPAAPNPEDLPVSLPRDYLIRQVEQAARALAVIIAKAGQGKGGEALGMFDEAYKPMLGVGAKVVPVLGDKQLLDMLRPGGVPDDNRWPVLVRLLTTEADLYAERGDLEEALARYRRALTLLRELGAGRALPDTEAAGDLADRIRAYHLGVAEQLDVAAVYEQVGRFDAAEDVLFAAVEDDATDTAADAAIALYRRLLARSDEELEQGGLPRPEVQESLSEILSRPAHPAS